MKKSIYNIVGVDNLIKELFNKGVKVSNVDISIANAIFELTSECVKRGREDHDGLIIKPVEGFIYSDKIATLIKSFPNAAILIASLDRNNNYGFVNESGKVYRTGMMGDIDPIMEAKEMVEAYIGDDSKRKKLFASNEKYQTYVENRRNNKLEGLNGDVLTSDQFDYEYNCTGRSNYRR